MVYTIPNRSYTAITFEPPASRNNNAYYIAMRVCGGFEYNSFGYIVEILPKRQTETRRSRNLFEIQRGHHIYR